jgi:hypothetical protein
MNLSIAKISWLYWITLRGSKSSSKRMKSHLFSRKTLKWHLEVSRLEYFPRKDPRWICTEPRLRHWNGLSWSCSHRFSVQLNPEIIQTYTFKETRPNLFSLPIVNFLIKPPKYTFGRRNPPFSMSKCTRSIRSIKHLSSNFAHVVFPWCCCSHT